MDWTIKSEEELSHIAQKVLELLPDGGLVFLKGEF